MLTNWKYVHVIDGTAEFQGTLIGCEKYRKNEWAGEGVIIPANQHKDIRQTDVDRERFYTP